MSSCGAKKRIFRFQDAKVCVNFRNSDIIYTKIFGFKTHAFVELRVAVAASSGQALSSHYDVYTMVFAVKTERSRAQRDEIPVRRAKLLFVSLRYSF